MHAITKAFAHVRDVIYDRETPPILTWPPIAIIAANWQKRSRQGGVRVRACVCVGVCMCMRASMDGWLFVDCVLIE